mmetsp:Transcript_23407/g.55600  ORF Transcript_23407/g.55600 Transcript_23407/m.55600 type:complete len:200 (+) Transcript_23407:1097-1696(+)
MPGGIASIKRLPTSRSASFVQSQNESRIADCESFMRFPMLAVFGSTISLEGRGEPNKFRGEARELEISATSCTVTKLGIPPGIRSRRDSEGAAGATGPGRKSSSSKAVAALCEGCVLVRSEVVGVKRTPLMPCRMVLSISTRLGTLRFFGSGACRLEGMSSFRMMELRLGIGIGTSKVLADLVLDACLFFTAPFEAPRS